ncbi:MAG TPA: site-2 protease family protein, partial [Polyangiaceae bacterium]|nr:site-2 protease family protein [Polyangiaceae bacterium]
MRGAKIGRIFGVEIRLDWSWMLIFVLLTWNLFAIFSLWHPDWLPLGNFAVAAIASLVFFGCILLHEIAHTLVARANGLSVHSITLFLFGGVSDIEREPSSPAAEFLTAIAGPITSVLLGFGFLFLASRLAPMPAADNPVMVIASLSPAATLLVWLGPINILIGLFNLIPAFPLDGGRVLRALLWALSGDLRRATRWSASIGQAIAWLFIAMGIAMTFGAYLPYFGTGFASGLWLAFIGWFLYLAASQARTRLALDDAFVGIAVAQLMQRDFLAVPPDVSLETLVHDYLIRGADRALPVVRDGEFLGLVSIAEVREVPASSWRTTPVSVVMRKADMLTVTAPDRPLAEAFERLAREDIDQLPVIAGDRLVGMLRRRDVARWLELAWKPPAAREGRARVAPPMPPGHEPHVRSV